jgi:copper chaperone CopZ
MKLHKYLMIVALSAMMLTSCKENSSEAVNTVAATETAAVKPETASFSIEGMSCSVGCAKTIEKKLAGMDGVQKATVDFEKKSAVIEFDATKQTAEKLAEAVEAAADGKTYKVADVKSSGDQAMLFDTDPVKKDKKKKKKSSAEDKKSCSPEESKSADGKPACCAAKKACAA